MSLLEFICCSRHRLRTAVAWDGLSQGLTCFQTYSDLLHVAETIASALSALPTPRRPIAIYGRNCPSVLAAVLAVMSLPGETPQAGGVACLDLDEVSVEQERRLQACGVKVVLVEESAIDEFLSNCERWAELHLVSMDTSLGSIGLVIAQLSTNSDGQPPASSVPIDPAVIRHYKEQCDPKCYACRLSADISTTGPCPKSSCPSIFTSRRPISVCPTSIAYVLNTSGTTGHSKMVQVPHCCIVPNVVDLRSRFNITPDDIIFNAAPITFDPYFVEVFLALSTGSQLLMVPEATKASPSSLSEVLFQRQYTSVLQLTPALFYRFGEGVIRRVLGDDTRLRVLAFGGEVCPSAEKLSEWKSAENSTELYNIYGITEVSSWATCHRIPLTPRPPGGHHNFQDPQSGGVPLGEPLLGTRVEVRDMKTGGVVRRGQGTIWIGGSYRVCLIDGETTPPADSMCCSGDYGYVDGRGRLLYAGREDHQIKRWGHRVNLDAIQQSVLSQMDEVSSCVLHYSDETSSGPNLLHPFLGNTLTCYITLKPASLPLVGVGETTVVAKGCGREAGLLGRMRGFLPSHCIPDDVVVVDSSLPVTHHGKVDIPSLINQANESRLSKKPYSHTPLPRPPVLSPDSIPSLLVSTICSLSGLGVCSMDAKLTDLGLDSFDVVRIANQVKADLGRSEVESHDSHMTMLTEKLLDCKLCVVVEYIVGCLVVSHDSHMTSSEGVERRGACRARTIEEVPGTKRARVDEKLTFSCELTSSDHVTFTGDHVTDNRDHMTTVESWRRGRCLVNGSLQNQEVRYTQSQLVDSIQLSVLWKVNTHRCVDASPLVVRTTRAGERIESKGLPEPSDNPPRAGEKAVTLQSENRGPLGPSDNSPRAAGGSKSESRGLLDSPRAVGVLKSDSRGLLGLSDNLRSIAEATRVSEMMTAGQGTEDIGHTSDSMTTKDTVTTVVYIGSHSHWFVAVEFVTGHVLWRTQLGDRVESSACISLCGQYVVVGCYDGCLYTLTADHGGIHWRFQPGGSEHPIKCSPCTDPRTGYVWFGSHDQHLYAVDIYGKRMLHKLYPGGGSIFATPCIDAERRSIYCATLQGLVVAYNVDSGSQLWTYHAGKPIFSSPCLTPSGDKVAFGCVDGTFCTLSTFSGTKNWIKRQLTPLRPWKIQQVDTGGCIFSSGCVLRLKPAGSHTGTKILCGSHSKHLYCWNEDLELEWKTELDSEVYSVPCYCRVQAKSDCRMMSHDHGNVSGNVSHDTSHDCETMSHDNGSMSHDCVCICSSRGVLYLVDAARGNVVAKLKLPSEVFSSPVGVDGCVIVGCRDDYVYCVGCAVDATI